MHFTAMRYSARTNNTNQEIGWRVEQANDQSRLCQGEHFEVASWVWRLILSSNLNLNLTVL
jgi:hypothetical protein